MQRRIAAALGAPDSPDEAAPLVIITTTGDRIQDRRLLEIGGKALFTKEIEEALLEGRVDAAIHSMKDVPAEMPPGLVIAAIPEREDPRDAFVSALYGSLGELPPGAAAGHGLSAPTRPRPCMCGRTSTSLCFAATSTPG